MTDITPQMARAELAKRELARRGTPYQEPEAAPQYEEGSDSLIGKLGEYLQGYGPGLLQTGAEAGYQLGMLPSHVSQAITGKPGYQLVKPDVLGRAPKTESGQFGAKVGHGVGELAMALMPITEGAKAGAEVGRALPEVASKDSIRATPTNESLP